LVRLDIVNSSIKSKFVLADSAGFWIVLFCGFGLIMLWTASARIAKRSNESSVRYQAAKIRAEKLSSVPIGPHGDHSDDQGGKASNHLEPKVSQNKEADLDRAEGKLSSNRSSDSGLLFGDNRLLIGGLSSVFVVGAVLVIRDWFAYRSQKTS